MADGDDAGSLNTVIKRPRRTITEIETWEVTKGELDALEASIGDSSVSLTFAAAFFGSTVSLVPSLFQTDPETNLVAWIAYLVFALVFGIAFVWFAVHAWRGRRKLRAALDAIRPRPSE